MKELFWPDDLYIGPCNRENPIFLAHMRHLYICLKLDHKVRSQIRSHIPTIVYVYMHVYIYVCDVHIYV